MRETTSSSDAEQTEDVTADTIPSGTTAPSVAVPGEQPAAIQTEPAASSWAAQLVNLAGRYPWLPLLLALLLSVAARVFLVARTHAMIDGDEALVGIQAEHILRGQYPTYFYGQAYMGSLEAYLAAAIFRVFGPSSWALRAVPIALSLLLVYLTWRLARALLPKDARTTPLLAGVAALVAAVPPLYDAVAELRTWGGQIEIYVVTLALLLATVELTSRLRANASTFELSRRWAVWGFLLGLGVWINPLVLYALVACGLWLVVPYLHSAFPRLWTRIVRRFGGVAATAGERPRWRAGAALPPLALAPGLLIGGLPAWLYAARHAGENLLVYVSQPSVSPVMSGAARHGRLFLGAAITARYFSCVAPRALDGGLPTEPLTELPLRLLLVLPPLAGAACAFWLVAKRSASPLRAGLPLLYGLVVTAVFCLGTSAWGATKACSMDWAGRYAVPLGLVEPFLLLALFAAPALWLALRLRSRRRGAPNGRISAVLARNGWTLALAVLLAGGIIQAGTYALAAPSTIFQSPYYRRIGLDQSQLLDYLKAHDIRAAWANHWEGNIVTFETDGATTCADYYDQVYMGGLHRPPGALETVEAATAPSFILIGADPHPLLAKELDAQGIAYSLAVLPQANVTVLTPTRTVDPASVIPGLGVDYPY